MNVLVTGGAGYIGSHTCIELLKAGYGLVVIDNFSNSSPSVIESIKKLSGKDFSFYCMDIHDRIKIVDIIKKHSIDSVIHFAGFKAVSESVSDPLSYYLNNVSASLELFEAMNETGVKKIVFSSSATVYGDTSENPVKENSFLNPSSPYGRTKKILEEILLDLSVSDKSWSVVALRYFNPVGAHPSGEIGESPSGPPNNLMPIIGRVASRQLEYLNIFGDDYPTFDGTGVRDFIHVIDLSLGHIAALKYLDRNSGFDVFNLGTGVGTSVFEILKIYEQINGVDIPYVFSDRREGDVAVSYADVSKANILLNWKASLGVNEMCRDAWAWQKNSNKD